MRLDLKGGAVFFRRQDRNGRAAGVQSLCGVDHAQGTHPPTPTHLNFERDSVQLNRRTGPKRRSNLKFKTKGGSGLCVTSGMLAGRPATSKDPRDKGRFTSTPVCEGREKAEWMNGGLSAGPRLPSRRTRTFEKGNRATPRDSGFIIPIDNPSSAGPAKMQFTLRSRMQRVFGQITTVTNKADASSSPGPTGLGQRTDRPAIGLGRPSCLKGTT